MTLYECPQSSRSSTVCESGRAVSSTSWPPVLEKLDERSEDEDVGGVREVDPDAHETILERVFVAPPCAGGRVASHTRVRFPPTLSCEG
jgi:hypothetical protein